MRRFGLRKQLFKALIYALILFVGQKTYAATITVTTINDAGVGSLRQAVADAVDGDVIRFDPALLTAGVDSISLQSVIVLNKSLSFKGLYTATDTLFISGGNSSKIFNIPTKWTAGNYEIVFDSIAFINGYNGHSGGAFTYDGRYEDTLKVYNCYFKNNVAGYGAIMRVHQNLKVVNTNFIGNRSIYSSGSGVECYGDMEMNNCVFEGNTSMEAVINQTYGGVFDISDCIINNNDGGAISGSSSGSDLVINLSNSKITNNSGESPIRIGTYTYGTYSPSASVSVSNCFISNNTNIGSNSGVIVCNTSSESSSASTNIDVDNSTIANNGGMHYGVVYCKSYSIASASVNITNSTIAENSSYSSTGKNVFCESDSSSSSISILNSTLHNNGTTSSQSFLYSNAPLSPNSSITLAGCILSDVNSPGNIEIYSNAGVSNLPIISNGYNVFTGAPSGAISSDYTNIANTQLNLGGLSANGSVNQVLLPQCGSIAINAGNPADNSLAQNGAILGVRDVGAAESSVTPSNTSSFNVTACSYTTPSGNATIITSQTVNDTIINSCGGDSVMTINVTIMPLSGTQNETVCYGGSITVNGTVYDANNPTGTEVFTNVGSNNCDSTVTVNLTVLPELTGTHNETVCFGGSITVNGTVYDANNLTGTEIFTNVGSNNCDSTVTVNLTIQAVDATTSLSGFTITANQAGASYQWLDCDNGNAVITGATAQSYTAPSNGNYAVVVTDGSCSDTSACVNIIGVGIADNNLLKDLSIYPNPTKGLFTVELSQVENNAKVVVYSVVGQEVVTQKIEQNNTVISLENYDKGIYFVSIQNGGSAITKRIVKH